MVDAREDMRVAIPRGRRVHEFAGGSTVAVTAPRDVTVSDIAPIVELEARRAGEGGDPGKAA